MFNILRLKHRKQKTNKNNNKKNTLLGKRRQERDNNERVIKVINNFNGPINTLNSTANGEINSSGGGGGGSDGYDLSSGAEEEQAGTDEDVEFVPHASDTRGTKSRGKRRGRDGSSR